jgi:large subunit ribosomal protein L31
MPLHRIQVPIPSFQRRGLRGGDLPKTLNINESFICRIWEDGNEYPVIKLEISNTSHPFYTGKNVLVDTAGRIDKFKKRYEKKAK